MKRSVKRSALRTTILASSLALLGAPMQAQSSPPPPGCGAPAHRQFDFWLGEWTVTDSAGQRTFGKNRITSEVAGCVLREQWESAGATPNTGQSLNYYDQGAKEWGQDWVGSGGDVLHLRGGLVGSAMVLEGEGRDPGGTMLRQRVTWTPYPDGRVRQLWQSSSDGGTTWTVAFDGWYRRVR